MTNNTKKMNTANDKDTNEVEINGQHKFTDQWIIDNANSLAYRETSL